MKLNTLVLVTEAGGTSVHTYSESTYPAVMEELHALMKSIAVRQSLENDLPPQNYAIIDFEKYTSTVYESELSVTYSVTAY